MSKKDVCYFCDGHGRFSLEEDPWSLKDKPVPKKNGDHKCHKCNGTGEIEIEEFGPVKDTHKGEIR